MLKHMKVFKQLVRFIPIRELVFFIAFQIASFALGVYAPLKLRLLFEQLIQQEARSIIWPTVNLVFIIVVAKIVCDMLSRLFITKLPNILSFNLRVGLFDLYKSMPYSLFIQHKREELSNMAENFTGECGMYLNYSCLFVMNLLNLLALWIAAFILSWKLAILLCVISPIYMYINRKVGINQQKIGSEVREVNMELNNELLYQTRSITSIKQNHSYSWHKTRLQEILHKFRDIQLRQGTHGVQATVLSDFAVLGFFGGITGLALHLTVSGKIAIDVFLAFLSIFGNITRPLSLVISHWINLNSRLPIVSKVLTFCHNNKNADQMNIDVDSNQNTSLGECALKVTDVSFSYPGSQEYVLKNLSFSVQLGEFVAVVGPSGAGKSTLFYLLAGLFTPTTGSIQVEGSIGVIPQVPYLFDGTIGDNIHLGRKYSNIEIEKALENAQLTGRAFDVNSSVVEQGKNFSLGEKQRIGIARTFITNSSVMLMDEPGANLDNDTHAKMMSVVENVKKSKTVLMIAHRIETIRNADRILVLNEGSIEGFGKWEEVQQLSQTFKNVLIAFGGEK